MRILLLTHAFNGLTQRLFVELTALGHDLSVEFDVNDAVTIEAVRMFAPDLVIAPYLRRAIPEEIWSRQTCLVVHPGPVGDRGPAALDWAILSGAEAWGVTVLSAAAEMDAGPVWATETFAMRPAAKSSLYRREVTEAAIRAVLKTLRMIEAGESPIPLGEHPDAPLPDPMAGWRGPVRAADRAIDWARDDSETVLRKIRSADGWPGVKDDVLGLEVRLFDACPAPGLGGKPGAIVARAGHAICRATADGAVWIGQLGHGGLKLPAVRVLGDRLDGVPEADGPRDIWIERADGAAFLHFPFYNGAMGVDHCRRLKAAFCEAASGPEKVVVLMGGPEFWSNGIHLGLIEAADSPSDCSMASIEAMDDLAQTLIEATHVHVIAALSGNAGAGGAFLALAADRVVARHGVVLNPHYKNMGNLYGSEYWTYLLPGRVGADGVAQVMGRRLPIGAKEAARIRLIDTTVDADHDAFAAQIRGMAAALARDPGLERLIADKAARRRADEAARPLSDYRADELARMRLNFYGFDPSYHVARYNFIFKVPHSRTPLHLAVHRNKGRESGGQGCREGAQ